jgi:CheY-like chemotaxis protein
MTATFEPGQLGSVRLIAITGYGQEADLAQAREAGFDLHVIKPVDLDQLQSAMGE